MLPVDAQLRYSAATQLRPVVHNYGCVGSVSVSREWERQVALDTLETDSQTISRVIALSGCHWTFIYTQNTLLGHRKVLEICIEGSLS